MAAQRAANTRAPTPSFGSKDRRRGRGTETALGAGMTLWLAVRAAQGGEQVKVAGNFFFGERGVSAALHTAFRRPSIRDLLLAPDCANARPRSLQLQLLRPRTACRLSFLLYRLLAADPHTPVNHAEERFDSQEEQGCALQTPSAARVRGVADFRFFRLQLLSRSSGNLRKSKAELLAEKHEGHGSTHLSSYQDKEGQVVKLQCGESDLRATGSPVSCDSLITHRLSDST